MSLEDRNRWDDRYRRGDHASATPSAILLELNSFLPSPGRVLDIAGGAGRHALWLARQGWSATIVDVSTVGLEIARDRADAWGVEIATINRDLETEPFPPGPWELVICFHYLCRSVLSAVANHLAPQGRLIVVQPTLRNLERNPRPPAEFLLQEGELPTLVRGLNMMHYREEWSSEGRHDAILIAERPLAARD